MKSVVKMALAAFLLIAGLARAQPTGFPPVSFEGWTLTHNVTARSAGGECWVTTEADPGGTKLLYVGGFGGQEFFVIVNPALDIRAGDRRTVQFQIGDFSTNLDMQFGGAGLLIYIRPDPGPPSFSELLRRSMLGRLERRNILVTIPNFQPAQFLSAGAPISDAYARCVGYILAERTRGR